MGMSDENILLDSRQVPWLGEALARLAQQHAQPSLLEVDVRTHEAHARVGQEFQALPKKIQREAIAAADNFNRVAQKSFGVRTHMRLG